MLGHFKAVVTAPKNKLFLGSCCGALCLFLQSAQLAVSLDEVTHKLQRLPCFVSALLLIATVGVIVYTLQTQKKTKWFVFI